MGARRGARARAAAAVIGPGRAFHVGLDGRTGTPIVVLREPESGSVLPIWVGPAEAQAIALSLHGVIPPRPMTHDLMASLIAELRAEVDEVVVTDLRANVFFGIVRLRVAGEKKIREVDSRPSDALALALRTGAPIRVARKILAGAPEFDFIAPEGPNQVVQALGMTVVVATPSLRKEFRLGDGRGVVVTSAFGLAREKGMRRGDLITEVNGRPSKNRRRSSRWSVDAGTSAGAHHVLARRRGARDRSSGRRAAVDPRATRAVHRLIRFDRSRWRPMFKACGDNLRAGWDDYELL